MLVIPSSQRDADTLLTNRRFLPSWLLPHTSVSRTYIAKLLRVSERQYADFAA